MDDDPNRDQAAFWNDAPGQCWAENQPAMDAMAAGVTDLLLEAAQPAAGERVLDIGCGAGASSLALAAAVGADGAVLGVDVSAPLLALAERRRAEAGLANVRFLRADAQVHRFEAGGHDLAASRFGAMFFADPVAAFANIGRALRPGGRLALVAWAEAERNPWFSLTAAVAAAVLGPSEPTAPGAPGPMAFSDGARVCGLLREAGFAECAAVHTDAILTPPGGVPGGVALAMQIGPISRAMRERGGSDADAAAIRARLADALAPYAGAGGLRLPAALVVYRAVWP